MSVSSTQKAYDLWSSQYDTLDNPMIAMVDRAFALEPLNLSHLRVLELGCGTGKNIARILSMNPASYIGIDQSPGMLQKARAAYPSVQFLEGDIEKKVPVADASVDFVLVTLVFEHLPFLLPTLNEAFRVLAPNGNLRILELHSDLRAQGTQAHFQHEGQEIQIASFAHDSDEWSTALTRAGFSIRSIKTLFPDDHAIARCAKLAKHRGKAVLFDICAGKGTLEFR